MEILGIDIGGSGIKASLVDTSTGSLLSERYRIPTPEDTSPHKILARVHEVVKHYSWSGPIGITLPEPVRNGVVLSTYNIDSSWLDADASTLFEEITDCPVTVVNDADAAGIAEIRFGEGRNHKGLVIVLTVGTGIGSALFMNGVLVPNTELGHIEINGISARVRASEKTRVEEGLKRSKWAKRLELVLSSYEKLFHPDLFIISGGLSNKADKTFPYIDIKTPLVPARFLNNAGIVGAALCAEDQFNNKVV
ncbi:MAG: ROK family protein [Rhodothermaceae bacterium]|nr:ROK family protein [Rhodothermaceae bacterium]